MVKVRVPMMVDDTRFAPLGRPEAIEGYDITGEDWFGDGPSTSRVAVVDRDLATGILYPPAKYVPPGRGRVLGRYAIQEPYHVDSRTFNQVSTFATVMKTIRMFEERDTLGRRVRWAFPHPQLTVLPRAGWGENAFYRRERGSLEFAYFLSHHDPSQIIYTSMARDIVAHETAHAILDGIVPQLWEALRPQSRALHEAIADLTALLVSIRSRVLRSTVLRLIGGSIEHSSQFSAIGEEFGMARGSGALRDLKNDLKMSDVPREDEYRLSQVLTGAFYSLLVKMHAQRTAAEAARRGSSEYSASGYGLWTASEHLKRIALRALDYLPPGEVSFADYGRAVLAADQASHPEETQERMWLIDEFVRRGIVPDREALESASSDARRAGELLNGAMLNQLAASDAAAGAFVGSNLGREVLRIPESAEVVLEPRLVVAKEYYHRSPDGILWPLTVREGLLKVSWWEWEESAPPVECERRRISVGTTMSWDWDSGRVRVLLTSDRRSGHTGLQGQSRPGEPAGSSGDLPGARETGCS